MEEGSKRRGGGGSGVNWRKLSGRGEKSGIQERDRVSERENECV